MSDSINHTYLKKLTTESGYTFTHPVVAWQSWGSLKEARDNVVLICHALTGNTNAADWFSGLIGPGKAIDPQHHFVICPNILGSCYGTIGPTSINPEKKKPFQGDFPEISIRDMVRLNQMLLDDLGITGIELAVGGSLGGMQALEFALMDFRVKKTALFAMGKAHTPWAIGISQAQRKAIYADQNWNGGFYSDDLQPKKGLAAARAMAMLTYRSPEDYNVKFARNIQPEKNMYQVESYLDYQGKKLAARFDANSYITLTKAMDTHDVSRDRGSFHEVLGSLTKPVLIVGFDSDLLYPIYEQKELAGLIPNSTFVEINSSYGHDAFLIEFKQLNQHLLSFSHSLIQ